MNANEHLMVIAMEECAEVSHRISKALRFGMDEIQPSQDKTNRTRIKSEYIDLIAVMELLGFISFDRDAIDAKKMKIEKYRDYSRSLGIIS